MLQTVLYLCFIRASGCLGVSQAPRPPECLKLTGSTDEWRIRVGDWRVVYRIDDGRVVVMVVRVAPRGGAYRSPAVTPERRAGGQGNHPGSPALMR